MLSEFVALITATLPEPIPKDWNDRSAGIGVLHTHLPAMGVTDRQKHGSQARRQRARRKWESSEEEARRDGRISQDHVFCDVEVGLFSVQIDGFTFGLVDASKLEEGYESVHLLPNDFAFFEPWNGEFDR